MSVFVVAQGRIEDRDKIDEYVAKIMPTMKGSGGRLLGFDETPDMIEGEVSHPRTVIAEFPSKEAFQKWYDSEAYQAILSLRLEGAPGTLILVDGIAPAS